ncbi:mRNA capping enzyme [Stereum hirsutum FP-91666 SS1]|uniref:mRNA capping enzyme n=1 Tax=Stereum hirsutum (strain FP-91666) TaxID=721885 RepID=UPI000440C443|nr:mRNA capping enzyme [Stereum hirsutum FP-91666 SS1]EIM90002.1 mRNA capping enzyme [Stereum hirsutum FP-91666 SS1]
MSSVPLELPGSVIPRGSEIDAWLKGLVAGLCGLEHDRFPGSQPVSFGTRDLDRLEKQDYWVCEKSDGIRVLFVVLTNPDGSTQLVYIVDRKNEYRQLDGMYFPHWENPARPLGSTIVDAELVIDTDPRTKQTTLRMLCFDCIVADGQNVMDRNLEKRYGRLREHFYKPYSKMMSDHPHMRASQPFDIRVKEINLSYHLEKVFDVDIPKLQHGNDGLIYTPVTTPYVPGTDTNILKWKPPSENSIDFKLVLRFPSLPSRPNQPDLGAKPVFALHVWNGGEGARAQYEPYDVMYVEDEEWEQWKASREQLDDRIVEVHWDNVKEHWRFMRFRDDKLHGNHRKVVEGIIQSIADGVEKDDLLARSTAIKNAWKARHGQPSQSSQPPPHPHSQHPPPSHHPSSHHQQQNPNPYAQGPPPPPLPSKKAPIVAPRVERNYGPLASSPWSKVSGPAVVSGFKR